MFAYKKHILTSTRRPWRDFSTSTAWRPRSQFLLSLASPPSTGNFVNHCGWCHDKCRQRVIIFLHLIIVIRESLRPPALVVAAASLSSSCLQNDNTRWLLFRRGRKIKIVFCLDVHGLLGCFRFRFTYESSGIRTDGRAEDAPPRNYSFGKTAGLVVIGGYLCTRSRQFESINGNCMFYFSNLFMFEKTDIFSLSTQIVTWHTSFSYYYHPLPCNVSLLGKCGFILYPKQTLMDIWFSPIKMR